VRLYTNRIPNQVVGVVLIEPSNEERWSLIAGLQNQWEGFRNDCRFDKWKTRFGLMRLSPQPLQEYPRSVRTLAEALSYAPKAQAANCAEINSILRDGPQQIARARTIWNIPLIVITGGQNISPRMHVCLTETEPVASGKKCRWMQPTCLREENRSSR
jgi:hypothetical protein